MESSKAPYDPARDMELARLLVENGLEAKFFPEQVTQAPSSLRNFLDTLKSDVLKKHGDQKGSLLIKQYEKEADEKFA